MPCDLRWEKGFMIVVVVSQKYLTDEEFAKIFGMEKHEFDAKPRWKQIDLKKKYKLF